MIDNQLLIDIPTDALGAGWRLDIEGLRVYDGLNRIPETWPPAGAEPVALIPAWSAIVLHVGVSGVLLLGPGVGYPDATEEVCTWTSNTSVRLSLADQATRDRFERWAPLATFLHALPEHRVVFHGMSWLYGKAAPNAAFWFIAPSYPPRSAWVNAECVPQLATIADGSPLADARGFHAVLRHILREREKNG